MSEFRWRRLRQRQYAREVREWVASGGQVEGWPQHGGSPHTLSLASADETLHFNANVCFWTWWGGSEQAPPGLLDIAGAGIARRAEAISVRHRLTASERLRGELNTALLHWEPVAGSPVQARGHCVSVDVDPELLAAVEEHEKAITQQVVLSWRNRQRRQQQEQMCSLLLDPLRATAWWLLDNQDRPEEAVTIAQKFQELRNILQPEKQLYSAGELVDELLTTMDEAVRTHMISRLRRVFSEYERDDLADRLCPPGGD